MVDFVVGLEGSGLRFVRLRRLSVEHGRGGSGASDPCGFRGLGV